MKIEEIKTAIDNGKRVHWHHSGYEVIGSRKDGYLIKCHMNNHCVGLHGLEGTKFENQMNGEEKDFFIRMSDPAEMDFPFEVIAQFDTWKEAKSAGISDENLWSVTEGEDDDDDAGTGCETYGPPHHCVNLLHIVQTAEAHDGETYHEVTFERGR